MLAAFAELVLADTGPVAYGHPVSYDVYRLSPDRIVELLGQAGLVVRARLLREPERLEKTRQAYLIAGRPGPS